MESSFKTPQTPKVKKSRSKTSAQSAEKISEVSESGSDTATSAQTDGILQSRKRSLRRGQKLEYSGDEDESPAAKVSTARRGRGRAGLAQLKTNFIADMKNHDSDDRTDEDDARIFKSAAVLRATQQQPEAMLNPEERPIPYLEKEVSLALDVITSVSRRSKGLKGTLIKELKHSVSVIRGAVSAGFNRTTSDEIRVLRGENARLTQDLAELRKRQEQLEESRKKEIDSTDLRQELTKFRAELQSEFRAKISFLEGKLLRPPLAADNRQPAPAAAMAPAAPSYAEQVKTPKRVQAAAVKPKARPKSVKANKPTQALPTPPKEQVTAPIAGANQWEVVGNKRKLAKAKKKAAKKAKKVAKTAARRLQAPRSTAVVLTLQPEAIEKGATYAELLKKARTKIEPKDLGITAGLRCRTTQTGARLLEVPGAESGDQADRLAASLREALGDDGVLISRPQKTCELRISGLDDSVSKEEVVAAVARAGACPVDSVRCRDIRQGRAGTGTIIVTCPVAAAKRLADGRRVLIGWVSAQVKILDPRPARCYRCLCNGHVGVKCTSQVDCSNRCFHCGQPGHKADTCTATPHCIFCAAMGKSADHRAGGKGCAGTQKPHKLPKPPTATPSASKKVAAPAIEGTETSMETQ